MKILVFMSDNRSLEQTFEKTDYNSLVAAINYEYCKKHNYDFIYYVPYLNNENDITLYSCIDPNTNTPRHSAWTKLLSTKLALQLSYDYIVYIDSDCIFKDFTKSLEDFIKPYMEIDKDVIFINNKPWNHEKPCSGFYICKVCPNVCQFINDWYNFDFGTRKNPCRFEQGALWYLYKDTQYNIVIVDDWMFKEKTGQFLRHIGTFEKNYRITYFKKFISVNNIDFTSNISNIQCIKYNTNNL